MMFTARQVEMCVFVYFCKQGIFEKRGHFGQASQLYH